MGGEEGTAVNTGRGSYHVGMPDHINVECGDEELPGVVPPELQEAQVSPHACAQKPAGAPVG